MKALGTALAALAMPLCLAAEDASSCRASFINGELVIANRHIERHWRVTDGLLYATSFRDLDRGVEWLAHPSRQPAPYPATDLAREKRTVEFKTRRGKASAVEAESLVAEMAAPGSATLRYRFQIFPESSGVRVEFAVEGVGGAASGPTGAANAAQPSGVENDRTAGRGAQSLVKDALENLELAPPHLRLTQVSFADQTDAHNELVFASEWLLHTSESVRVPGNLFVVEDTLQRAGLIFLKEAPLPHARPEKAEADFAWDPRASSVALLGNGYRYVTLAYSGGRTGRIAALQDYQRQLRAYDPRRDAMFLSNTWGDRSRDARINEEFLRKEVAAGARLGVDVIQIDDGWEKGRTSNSASAAGKGVFTGYWARDPDFWSVDATRFPHGLEPIVKLAAEKHMQFGLWFGPDSSNDFGEWQRDARKILELERTLGIRYFKIDGVKAYTRRSERNLRRFFDAVLDGVLNPGAGAVTFDLDVTAQIRPGYFGMMNTGPLFVENRYTDWHRYWPHQTLRNLWKLAEWVDPLRLRMEFLNNSRNTNLYANDPLAPERYEPAALFATVMCANPLGWFEMSNLPERYFEQLPPLVAAWKQERSKMFANRILPIGTAPDGVAWTGFLSQARDRRSGYALVFRELNEAAEAALEIPDFEPGKYAATVLGGAGAAEVTGGRLRVRIPRELGFVWVRIDRE